MIPNTVSTRRSPRLVTVIVGSDSSELRNAPLLAGDEIAQPHHQLVERKLTRIMDRRRDEATAADRDRRPDMDAGAGRKRARANRGGSSAAWL